MPAELLAGDPLPGIELEQRFNRGLVEIDEPCSVPADVFDRDARGGEARLRRGIAKIFDRAAVFVIVPDGGEVDPRAPQPEVFPGLDQPLVDGIELIAP